MKWAPLLKISKHQRIEADKEIPYIAKLFDTLEPLTLAFKENIRKYESLNKTVKSC